MFKTLTAKYAGTCKRCNQPITIGQTIRYGGKGRTYHLASFCAGGIATPIDPADLTPAFPQDDADQIVRELLATETPDAFSVTDDTPQAFTFTTIAGATVTTAPTVNRAAGIPVDATPSAAARHNYIATPKGPVSTRTIGTAADYGTRGDYSPFEPF